MGRIGRVVATLGAVGWAAYAVSVFLSWRPPAVSWAHELVPVWIPALAAALCVDAARRRRESRPSWILFALGCVSWAAGDLAHTVIERTGGEATAAFTTADVGYLALIPCWCAALLLHPSRPQRGLELGGSVVDALTVVTVASCATAAFVLIPIVRDEGGIGGALVTLLYPVGDLALVAAFAALIAKTGAHIERGEAAIAAAVLMFAVADIIHARLALTHTYRTGSPIDLTWEVAFVLVMLASRSGLAVRERDVAAPVEGLLAFAGVSGVAILTGLGLVSRERTVLLTGAAVAALLIAARQSLLVVHNARLARALEEGVRELESQAMAKEEFIATVSHDLRSPLSAIRGFAELLQTPQASESRDLVVEFAQTIARNADRLRWLVEDLLLAGEYAAGHAPNIMKAPTNLLDTASRTITDLGRQDRVVVDGEPTMVVADQHRLQQIVTNLVDNAIKHSRSSSPVRVTTGREDGFGALTVADEGAGIPPERMREIFQPFVRFGQEASSVGLGLYIVRRLTEAMGGDVRATSQPGHGTTFTVLLPLASPS